MRPGWRILIAAAAVVQAAGATGALAQEVNQPAATNATETVGPRELRDFQLNGTVTRPAETPPTAPAATPRPAPPPAATSQSPPARTQAPPQTADRQATTSGERSAASPARSATLDLPPPTPSAQLPAPAVAPIDGSTDAAPEPTFTSPPASPALGDGSGAPSMMPWLIAALALAGGAAFYFLRVRPRAQFAGSAGLSEFRGAPAPQPAPTPVPRPASPAPAPAKPPASSGGVVSSRLRPWLEIEFAPDRTIVDDEKVTVEFVVSLFNSGSGPARDILVEGGLFNAGPQQDKQIGMFFQNPVAQGDRIPALPPLQRIAVRSAVVLPRAQVQPIEVEGRSLLVPLVGFNVLYRFGSGSEAQTSASYLVGKETKGEKLAPFRLDVGPRIFRGLGVREHELRVRR